MEISRKWRFSCLLLGLFFLATTLQGVQGEVELGPSESECRPYIEKALKELETAETEPVDPGTPTTEDTENASVLEGTIDDSEHETSAGEDDTDKGDNTESTETQQKESEISTETQEHEEDQSKEDNEEKSVEEANKEQSDETVAQGDTEDKQNQEFLEQNDAAAESQEAQAESQEAQAESQEAQAESQETQGESQEAQTESQETVAESQEAQAESTEAPQEDAVESQEGPAESQEAQGESQEVQAASHEDPTESQEAPAGSQEVPAESQEATETSQEQTGSQETTSQSTEADTAAESVESPDEEQKTDGESAEAKPTESTEKTDDAASVEKTEDDAGASTETAESVEVDKETTEAEETKEASVEETEAVEQPQADEPATESQEDVKEVDEAETETQTEEVTDEAEKSEETKEEVKEGEEVKEAEQDVKEGEEVLEEQAKEDEEVKEGEEAKEEGEVAAKIVEGEAEATETKEGEESETEEETKEAVPEEDLNLEFEIPENLRPRDQVDQLLKLDDDNSETEAVLNNVAQITLKELKKLYENAIKPLETLYKYRDLSNRHFGDSEIFSKPLVLFMGPWSGGKSSIINYLLDNEYNVTSLRTGAEPSPAYFNLLMHGDEPEVLDGTQLAADFTFAGLQKFGQGLEERLRGLKLPSKLLEKINIVEIPGILEVRKQVSRVFPFNDACQWFIDRADIIFLVYDPSKLDVGPETEAILDQLKGREHQTRIILNKADQVKPEELMRVQGALIWNISPLMSSAQPPVMYTTSLWSRPYETWAPVRLLQAQERAFLRDLRSAVDKRIENKISSARRFAVRVRNHAKMVDCYLTTYYNHKSVFGNRKQVSDQIIEHPQDYHIYEGLSTLTNISRYDLPDPDVYKGFFRLNPLYDFQQLSATCTYFRGCPINRLDVAIAYDLPELVGKHKKLVEAALSEIKTES